MRAAGRIALAFMLMTSAAYAQSPPCPAASTQAPCISFTRDWPAAAVPMYTFILQKDGAAQYGQGAGKADAEMALHPLPRLSPAAVDRIYATTEGLESKTCTGREPKVAQTGRKTLQVFAGPVVLATCTFNYSTLQNLNELADLFGAIVETLQAGQRLEHLHRFDRLGLDAELDALTAAVQDSRALETQTIAATLKAIAEDDRVMQRARRKATALLENAPPSKPN